MKVAWLTIGLQILDKIEKQQKILT